MTSIGQYIVSVSATAFFFGIVNSFVNHGPNRQLIKMVCGAYMLILVASPVFRITPVDIFDAYKDINIEAREYVSEGEIMAETEYRAIIKAEIKQRIADMFPHNNNIEIDVHLESENDFPEFVTIRGNFSEEEKNILTEKIYLDLGIPAEDQLWTE